MRPAPALLAALAAPALVLAPRLTRAAQSAPYVVAYDVARLVLPGWRHALVGVAVGALGLALLRAASTPRRVALRRVALRAVGTTLAIFGFFGALVVGGGMFTQHARLRAAMRDGTFSVIEGTVYDRPPSTLGERAGAWVIESGGEAHWYRYDASPFGVGYHRAAPGGGGLHDGTRVRVSDVGGRIARVEVAAQGAGRR